MSAALRRRTERVEAPYQQSQMVAFIEGPMDMSLETAMEMLKFDGANHSAIFYYGIRKLGERPRHMGGPEVVSDEEWEKHKNYPRVRGWWNDDQGELDQYPELADRPRDIRAEEIRAEEIRAEDAPAPENTSGVAARDSPARDEDRGRVEDWQRAWNEVDNQYR